MKKEVWAAFLFFILASVPLMVFGVQRVRAESNVLTVDDNGPADFQFIQDAVDAAQEGDTIEVRAGTYHEHVVINKSVSLIGDDRSTTIIDGNNAGVVVLVTADNVTIRGFTVRNGRSGIVVLTSYNCTVEDNLADNHSYQGIFFNQSQNCIASRNYVLRTRSGYGINAFSSRNILVSENCAAENYFDGVGLLNSDDSMVIGNTVNDNVLFGIWVDSSNNNIIHHNNFFNNSKHVSSNTPTNFWDDGHEGNYWSNYTGIDADGDGVGDEPYIVDKKTQQRDNYPLMHPHVNEIYLSVDTTAPVASFTYSSGQLFVNKTVSFDASGSYDSVGKNAIVSFEWSFGDGSSGTGITVNHTYSSPNNFTVFLKTVDAAGNEDTVSAEIQVLLEDVPDEQTFPTLTVGVLVMVVVLGLVVFVLWRKGKLLR